MMTGGPIDGDEARVEAETMSGIGIGIGIGGVHVHVRRLASIMYPVPALAQEHDEIGTAPEKGSQQDVRARVRGSERRNEGRQDLAHVQNRKTGSDESIARVLVRPPRPRLHPHTTKVREGRRSIENGVGVETRRKGRRTRRRTRKKRRGILRQLRNGESMG